jgi:uncharacterized circularly permuted ATP-grasp superfamily protein
MKVYYIEYLSDDQREVLEVFTSLTEAKRRVNELKKTQKEVQSLWREYIIHNKRGDKPTQRPLHQLPNSVKTAEFAIKSEGIVEAFRYLNDKR